MVNRGKKILFWFCSIIKSEPLFGTSASNRRAWWRGRGSWPGRRSAPRGTPWTRQGGPVQSTQYVKQWFWSIMMYTHPHPNNTPLNENYKNIFLEILWLDMYNNFSHYFMISGIIGSKSLIYRTFSPHGIFLHVQNSTVQYSTVQYSTVQYSIV